MVVVALVVLGIGVGAVVVSGSVALDALDAWRATRRAPTLADPSLAAGAWRAGLAAARSQLLRSVRARRWSVGVLVVVAIALGAMHVVRTVRDRPAELARALRTTPPQFDPPTSDEHGPVTVPGGVAPGSTALAEDPSPVSGCPLFRTYREAYVAAHRLALAPLDDDSADRRAYDVALAHLREAFPLLPGEIDTWDRIERQWIDEVQHRKVLPAAPDHLGFDSPDFVAAMRQIQDAIDRGCGPRR